MKGTLKPPEIPEKDQSPIVKQLLAFIEHQNIIIQQQAEQIQLLKDEIARLKNQPPRPDIKPSSLGKSKKRSSKSSRNKRPGSKKRSKTAHLKIHKTDPVEPDEIPIGSQFRYYKVSANLTPSSQPGLFMPRCPPIIKRRENHDKSRSCGNKETILERTR
jgi:hypothetical protein